MAIATAFTAFLKTREALQPIDRPVYSSYRTTDQSPPSLAASLKRRHRKCRGAANAFPTQALCARALTMNAMVSRAKRDAGEERDFEQLKLRFSGIIAEWPTLPWPEVSPSTRQHPAITL
jgi:hypothetical protein